MSSRYDEHDDDDLDDLRPSRRRSRRDECPHCGCRDEPITRSEISQAGWIVFVVMIVVCWPLFWIGLLMTENYEQCPECRRRV